MKQTTIPRQSAESVTLGLNWLAQQAFDHAPLTFQGVPLRVEDSSPVRADTPQTPRGNRLTALTGRISEAVPDTLRSANWQMREALAQTDGQVSELLGTLLQSNPNVDRAIAILDNVYKAMEPIATHFGIDKAMVLTGRIAAALKKLKHGEDLVALNAAFATLAKHANAQPPVNAPLTPPKNSPLTMDAVQVICSLVSAEVSGLMGTKFARPARDWLKTLLNKASQSSPDRIGAMYHQALADAAQHQRKTGVTFSAPGKPDERDAIDMVINDLTDMRPNVAANLFAKLSDSDVLNIVSRLDKQSTLFAISKDYVPLRMENARKAFDKNVDALLKPHTDSAALASHLIDAARNFETYASFCKVSGLQISSLAEQQRAKLAAAMGPLLQQDESDFTTLSDTTLLQLQTALRQLTVRSAPAVEQEIDARAEVRLAPYKLALMETLSALQSTPGQQANLVVALKALRQAGAYSSAIAEHHQRLHGRHMQADEVIRFRKDLTGEVVRSISRGTLEALARGINGAEMVALISRLKQIAVTQNINGPRSPGFQIFQLIYDLESLRDTVAAESSTPKTFAPFNGNFQTDLTDVLRSIGIAVDAEMNIRFLQGQVDQFVQDMQRDNTEALLKSGRLVSFSGGLTVDPSFLRDLDRCVFTVEDSNGQKRTLPIDRGQTDKQLRQEAALAWLLNALDGNTAQLSVLSRVSHQGALAGIIMAMDTAQSPILLDDKTPGRLVGSTKRDQAAEMSDRVEFIWKKRTDGSVERCSIFEIRAPEFLLVSKPEGGHQIVPLLKGGHARFEGSLTATANAKILDPTQAKNPILFDYYIRQDPWSAAANVEYGEPDPSFFAPGADKTFLLHLRAYAATQFSTENADFLIQMEEFHRAPSLLLARTMFATFGEDKPRAVNVSGAATAAMKSALEARATEQDQLAMWAAAFQLARADIVVGLRDTLAKFVAAVSDKRFDPNNPPEIVETPFQKTLATQAKEQIDAEVAQWRLERAPESKS